MAGLGRSPQHWAVLVALAVAFAFASDRAAGSASLSAGVVGPETIEPSDTAAATWSRPSEISPPARR